MTARRIAILTLWALAVLAAAFALRARSQDSDPVVASLLEPEIVETFEVAIEPLGTPTIITFTPDPEPTPMAEATTVAPPEWIEIPADLVATPTPLADNAPLPMLTNIASVPRDARSVYLTFDDGPDPLYTNQILDVLARYNAKATFFVLGQAVDSFPGTAQRIVAEGHALGNHTYFHEALPRETDEVVLQTLAATNNAIARATGLTPRCMRPPYGSLDERTFDLVRGQGYSVSMWEVDSEDWKHNDAYTIAAGVLRDTSLGNRVLFHDGPANRAATVVALESVLSVLTQRGVTFAPLTC